MNVVHISQDSASKSLHKALAKHTKVNSDHFLFPSNVCNGSVPEELLRAVEAADIVHVHGGGNIETVGWAHSLRKAAPRVQWVQQYYDLPQGCLPSSSKPEIPQLAFLNHVERYLPYARVMPSVTLESEIKPVRLQENVECLNLGIIKRKGRSAWEVPVSGNRWVCEGFRETYSMAEHLVWKFSHLDRPMRLLEIDALPEEDCLHLCRRLDLLIDSLVTGTFSPSSLEYLALGIPCFIHLDNRCFDNLLAMTGAEELPWVFTRVEEADTMIGELVNDSELRVVLAKNARDWVERYYGEKKTIEHYVRTYEYFLEKPEAWCEPRFDLKNPKTFWDMQEAHDTIYEARRRASGYGRSILADEFKEHEHAGTSQLFHFARGPEQAWLYRNRLQRMDGLEPLFDVTRRQCLLERYAFAAEEAEGKRVLDLGSGTGYGSALLKSEGRAGSVLGIDHDAVAVNYANGQYGDKGLVFNQGMVETAELPEEGFDCITAFGILEHVKGDGTFLKRCHAWLKPGGVLMISSPDTWHVEMVHSHRRNHSRITFENFIKRVFPQAEFFIQEPEFSCSDPARFEQRTIRPCIPEDYLEPGQVIIAKCLK